jgi:prepilin-type N-terminal cleavage/methylation domain-containing protein
MRAQEKNIRGFNLLELLVVIVIISVISAVAYPNFSSWKKEREVRGAAVKIKNLFTSINSQVQRGLYGFVQVEVTENLGVLTVISRGMKMTTLSSKINDGANLWNSDSTSRCEPDQDWDDDGSLDDKLEVSSLEFKDIAVDFENSYGTVCFSKDGTWFSGSKAFVSGESVNSVFFICGQTSVISKCDVSIKESTDKEEEFTEELIKPNIEDEDSPFFHDNLFALNWSRFGSVTIEKWSKSKEDWILQ